MNAIHLPYKYQHYQKVLAMCDLVITDVLSINLVFMLVN